MPHRPFPVRILATSAVVALLGWTHATHSAKHVVRGIPAAIDAPFRDGVFQGRLSAEHCKVPDAPVGRWSDPAERLRFAEGYQAAFSAAVRMKVACTATREGPLSQR